MKKFILSDLHIGLGQAQYEIMDEAIKYIRQNAQPGDEVLGLGDWFHMREKGFDYCISHPMTGKFRALAEHIPINLVPGNHDRHLEVHRDDPQLANPISPIKLIKPFMENGIWYCHGHEFDPVVQYIGWFPALWAWLTNLRTPGKYRGGIITEGYLMMVYLIYSRASLSVQKKAIIDGRDYKGIVLGHTHLPFQHQSPQLPVLIDDGDMRHSSTFLIRDENEFRLMQWDSTSKQWLMASSLKV